jgi:hypothetical protein
MPEPRTMITVKGEAKQPHYFADEINGDTKPKSPIYNVPAMIALVAVGVGIILFMRSRTKTYTTPALTLTPDYNSDSSSVLNLANSLAASGLVYNPNPDAPTVGGGVSTPVTTAG